MYVCSVCDKVFHATGNLSRHKVVHSDARPHACRYCQNTFKRKDHLKEHIKAVHCRKVNLGDRPMEPQEASSRMEDESDGERGAPASGRLTQQSLVDSLLQICRSPQFRQRIESASRERSLASNFSYLVLPLSFPSQTAQFSPQDLSLDALPSMTLRSRRAGGGGAGDGTTDICISINQQVPVHCVRQRVGILSAPVAVSHPVLQQLSAINMSWTQQAASGHQETQEPRNEEVTAGQRVEGARTGIDHSLQVAAVSSSEISEVSQEQHQEQQPSSNRVDVAVNPDAAVQVTPPEPPSRENSAEAPKAAGELNQVACPDDGCGRTFPSRRSLAVHSRVHKRKRDIEFYQPRNFYKYRYIKPKKTDKRCKLHDMYYAAKLRREVERRERAAKLAQARKERAAAKRKRKEGGNANNNNSRDKEKEYFRQLGWTDEELLAFEQGLGVHGKLFGKVAESIPNKSTKDVVLFYYMWKKRRPQVYKPLKMIWRRERQRRELEERRAQEKRRAES